MPTNCGTDTLKLLLNSSKQTVECLSVTGCHQQAIYFIKTFDTLIRKDLDAFLQCWASSFNNFM